MRVRKRRKGKPWNKGQTKVKSKLCLCGCGEYTQVHKYLRKNGGFQYCCNNFIKAHAKRRIGGYNPEIHRPHECACGCRQITNKRRGKYNLFIKGHENIGRVPWNKGKRFPESVRIKMSKAKIGVSPANKQNIDTRQLYRLYVIEKKNSGEVAKILNASIDAVKNRIRGQSWVRTSKESCSLESFKARMRDLQITRLSYLSRVGRDRINNLESKLYNILERYKIDYIPQYPMYNKFVVDAYLPKYNLVIEAFGRYWHNLPQIRKKDLSKRIYLKKCGHKIIELWEDEINKDDYMGKIIKEIKNGNDNFSL